MTDRAEMDKTELPDEATRQRMYEDALLHRYNNHLSLSKADRAEARRIIRKRATR